MSVLCAPSGAAVVNQDWRKRQSWPGGLPSSHLRPLACALRLPGSKSPPFVVDQRNQVNASAETVNVRAATRGHSSLPGLSATDLGRHVSCSTRQQADRHQWSGDCIAFVNTPTTSSTNLFEGSTCQSFFSVAVMKKPQITGFRCLNSSCPQRPISTRLMCLHADSKRTKQIRRAPMNVTLGPRGS